jgi:arsenate reductase-like glutaredoxin family protein
MSQTEDECPICQGSGVREDVLCTDGTDVSMISTCDYCGGVGALLVVDPTDCFLPKSQEAEPSVEEVRNWIARLDTLSIDRKRREPYRTLRTQLVTLLDEMVAEAVAKEAGP